MEESLFQTLANQIPFAVLIVVIIFWLLRRQDAQEECAHERRKEELKIQAAESEKQRLWNEDQEKKRNEFTKGINLSNQVFYEKLSKDQAESNRVVAETIRLVEKKTDLIIEKLGDHDNNARQALAEFSKWRGTVKKE